MDGPETVTMALMSDAAPRPRVLSGIQPTADSFHLGNYLGAVRNWVALQDTHDAFYCVVDLHAITMGHDPVALRNRTRLSVAQLLAPRARPGAVHPLRPVARARARPARLGAELHHRVRRGRPDGPVQGQVGQGRARTPPASGLFTYPILQAADILLYQADQVPVGEDQRQHLELTRDLAQRFNTRFGPTFTIPRRTSCGTPRRSPTCRTRREDVQVGVLAERHHRAARGAVPVGQEDQVGGHRHRPRDPLRRGEQARHQQPADHLRRADPADHRRAARAVRRAAATAT